MKTQTPTPTTQRYLIFRRDGASTRFLITAHTPQEAIRAAQSYARKYGWTWALDDLTSAMSIDG